MSSPDAAQLTHVPITCHAFNKSRDEVAICPNSNEIHIYRKSGNGWHKAETLLGHDQRVLGLDWAPESNLIVSCGEDRNAYVWSKQASGEWKPTLVILRINRAATCCKWSPKEDKFAVASGARLLSICYFEEENDWWVSKHIKRPIRSTILSLHWNPNNVLIAAGSSDFTCRIFSGYVKGVDKKPDPTVWGAKMKFGDMMKEYSCGGWVHDVAFSPSGNKLAFVGHDSSLNVVVGQEGVETETVSVLNSKDLPLKCLIWATESSIVGAGHDCVPLLFQCDDMNTWTFIHKLDQKKKKTVAASSAMNKFKMLDSRNTESSKNDTELNSVHQNAVSSITVFSTNADGSVAKFTTSGVDGRLVTWDIKSLESSIQGLKVF
eukprot:Nk52_evm17s2192 gene=Nk52_evmTU17s2192